MVKAKDTSKYVDRVLHIDFPEEEKDLVLSWKRMCMFKFGKGGIKERMITLLRKDLKDLEVLK